MIFKRFAAILQPTAAGRVVVGLLNSLPIHAQSAQKAGSPSPSFEVATIKPNKSGAASPSIMGGSGRIILTAATVKFVIGFAYHVRDFQISGGPSWVNSDRYDIEDKEPDAMVEASAKLSFDQVAGLLLQSLLADRFQLKVSRGTKELPIYALVVAKNGPKLHAAKPGDTYPNGFKGADGRPLHGYMRMAPGLIESQGAPFTFLVVQLSRQLGRTVLDQTGLKGNYDFTLKWTPDQGSGAMIPGVPGGGPGVDNAPAPDSSGPSIFTAIQEQLGLKLESAKGPVEIIVIDHVERPSEN